MYLMALVLLYLTAVQGKQVQDVFKGTLTVLSVFANILD